MGRYKTKIQSITEANQRILKEQFHVKSDEFENYYINSGIPIDKIEDNYYILGPINGHEMNIKFTDDGYYVVKPSYYGGYYEESPRSFEDVNSLIDYINNFNYDSHPDPKGAGFIIIFEKQFSFIVSPFSPVFGEFNLEYGFARQPFLLI